MCDVVEPALAMCSCCMTGCLYAPRGSLGTNFISGVYKPSGELFMPLRDSAGKEIGNGVPSQIAVTKKIIRRQNTRWRVMVMVEYKVSL